MTERTERRPSNIISRTVEMIENQTPLEERGRVRVEKNFDVIPTHINGLFLLAEHSQRPDPTMRQTEDLIEASRIYFITDSVIKALQELQKPRHKKLLGYGKTLSIRGSRDESEGWEVQITPSRSRVWNESVLDESLGESRPRYVHKARVYTITLDPDKDDVVGFEAALKRRIKRQGISKDKLKIDDTFTVDEKDLDKAVERGEVVLLEGAFEREIIGWRVDPKPFATDKDIMEAAEAAAKVLNVN